jgi:hypothetical protein
MDWLESYSPMKIHWKNKWMEIPYGNQLILLQGEVPETPENVLVQLCLLSEKGTQVTSVNLLPHEVQRLLDHFEVLFDTFDSWSPPGQHSVVSLPSGT